MMVYNSFPCEMQVAGTDFVVDAVVIQYKLVKVRSSISCHMRLVIILTEYELECTQPGWGGQVLILCVRGGMRGRTTDWTYGAQAATC